MTDSLPADVLPEIERFDVGTHINTLRSRRVPVILRVVRTGEGM